MTFSAAPSLPVCLLLLLMPRTYGKLSFVPRASRCISCLAFADDLMSLWPLYLVSLNARSAHSQIPDSQEVLISPDSDNSFIFDIVECVPPADLTKALECVPFLSFPCVFGCCRSR